MKRKHHANSLFSCGSINKVSDLFCRKLSRMASLASCFIGIASMTQTHADFTVSSNADFNNTVRLSQAAHFLSQASFGGTTSEIQVLADRIRVIGHIEACEEWIDDQFTKGRAQTYRQHYNTIGGGAGNPTFHRVTQRAFYNQCMYGEDQLRQRMVWALSQIYVVSNSYFNGLQRGGRIHTFTTFYDRLYDEAFTSHRSSLQNITYSPMMGGWLTYISNAKANPAVGSIPDQNYAREVMQLFTVGVFAQDASGNFQFDSNGVPIENYTEEDVVEFSEVFTGLTVDNNRSFFNENLSLLGTKDLIMQQNQHDTSTKVLLTRTLPANQNGNTDISQALDDLAYHPSTAPYFSRLLMKRFTSSNPSGDYVKRVTDAWYGNGPYGTNVEGDFKAVLKAILLDPEARNAIIFERDGSNVVTRHQRTFSRHPGIRGRTISGKVKEPLLKRIQMLRYLGATIQDNDRGRLGEAYRVQNLGTAPTVFNFYSEEFAPGDGPIGAFVTRWWNRRRQNIEVVAPELQIQFAEVLDDYNGIARTLNDAYSNPSGSTDEPRFSLIDNTLINTNADLVRLLNIYLCNGTMSSEVSSAIDDGFQISTNGATRTRINAALSSIYASPAYSINY